jgi:hypothetical protein
MMCLLGLATIGFQAAYWLESELRAMLLWGILTWGVTLAFTLKVICRVFSLPEASAFIIGGQAYFYTLGLLFGVRWLLERSNSKRQEREDLLKNQELQEAERLKDFSRVDGLFSQNIFLNLLRSPVTVEGVRAFFKSKEAASEDLLDLIENFPTKKSPYQD